MSEYKRLTLWGKNGAGLLACATLTCVGNDEIHCGENCPYEQESYNRLAEFEDKIESGEFGDITAERHRAEVAERAIKIYQERFSNIRCFDFNIAIKIAEQELQEGK